MATMQPAWSTCWLCGVLLCCMASMQPACAASAVSSAPSHMASASAALPKDQESLSSNPDGPPFEWVDKTDGANWDPKKVLTHDMEEEGFSREAIEEAWGMYTNETLLMDEIRKMEEGGEGETSEDDDPDVLSLVKLRGKPSQKAEARPQFAKKLAGEFDKQAKIADMRPDRVLRRWGWRIRCKYAEVQDGLLDYLGLLVEKVMPIAIVAMHFPPLSKYTREWGDKPGTVKDDDDEREAGPGTQAPQQGQVLQ